MLVLNTKFKDGNFAKLLNNHSKTKQQPEDSATQEYENVYNLFIEGNFEQAKAEKSKAYSLYGKSYWTPQLLYIESIYFVSKHDDTTAISTLTDLTNEFATSPLSQKAQTMIEVLRRRGEIENYLTNLQITRLPDDEPSAIVNLNPVENLVEKKEIKKDSLVNKPVTVIAKPNVDTLKTITGNVNTYVFNANDQQFVAILFKQGRSCLCKRNTQCV